MQKLLDAARAAGRNALSEAEAKQVISHFGVQVPRCSILRIEEDIESCVTPLRPPLALKALSHTLMHKSDAGGVRLDLCSAADVRKAMAAMRSDPRMAPHEIHGFLLEEMAARGHEVVIGGTWHPTFGPVVMVGLGGIFVELVSDTSFRLCPIERVDAKEMIADLRGAPALDGARGGLAASRDAVVEVLLAVGGANGLLLSAGGDIVELDLNPVIVDQFQATAVDARIVLRTPAP